MIRKIDDKVSVAPQITADEVAALAAAGFTGIINNRPDEEEGGQPTGDSIRAAAQEAGIAYAYVPVTHAGFSLSQIDAMASALTASAGPVLAFCRSGTRSCNLWALAAVKDGGESPNIVTAKAADAGYDISGIRPLLDQLQRAD